MATMTTMVMAAVTPAVVHVSSVSVRFVLWIQLTVFLLVVTMVMMLVTMALPPLDPSESFVDLGFFLLNQILPHGVFFLPFLQP